LEVNRPYIEDKPSHVVGNYFSFLNQGCAFCLMSMLYMLPKDVLILVCLRTMSNMKRKDIVDNGGVRPKAEWDVNTVKLYIKLCLDEVKKGEHNGTTLTKKGWKSVLSNINEKTGKDYGKKQLTNKWYNLRRDWQEWYKLFAKETLVGQDSAKNAMEEPDEWWEKKQLV